ncbi:MAG: hypothetical protein HWQ38_01745 [Nostoc sp. NMS7]|uniref:hypothetical protein n=1 Tax=Nostoc sp. NMS7 TaxID=2815391 RepID=UPI0025F4E2BF|nr:hypothetical protein [Nostoc sp. NMS7]MBN3945267.1 hypothetical protein [Nostoc sp. NMS7]
MGVEKLNLSQPLLIGTSILSLSVDGANGVVGGEIILTNQASNRCRLWITGFTV